MNMLSQRYPGVPEKLGVGSAVGDAAGVVAKGVGKVGVAVGGAAAGLAIGTAKVAGQIGLGVGKAALTGVGPVPGIPRMLGSAAIQTGKFMLTGYKIPHTNLKIESPIKATAKLAGKIGKNMVTYEPGHMEYNRYLGKLEKKGPSLHLSKFGAGVLGGLAAFQGIRGGMNAYMGSRMGTVDTKTTSLTPDYAPQEYKIQHPDFAGATGDLVFALDANRHG